MMLINYISIFNQQRRMVFTIEDQHLVMIYLLAFFPSVGIITILMLPHVLNMVHFLLRTYVDSDFANDTSHRKSVTFVNIKIAGGTVFYKRNSRTRLP